MGAIDEKRFEAIFDAHGAAVLAYLVRRTDRAAAEDALSETFLVAWRRSADLPVTEPRPWLYAVARHVLANQRRVDGRRAALLARLRRERSTGIAPASAISDPPGAATDAADGDLLDALRSLRPADQEVLMLDAWEGLSSSEAGTVLGCSPEAYRARLTRAKTRLRRAVGDTAAPAQTQATAEATR